MDHQILMGVLQCRADLAKQHQALSSREPLGVAVLIDGAALDVLHHEIWKTIGSRAAFEQTRDVWMFQIGEDLPLHHEPTQDDVRVHAAVDELDGDLLAILIVSPNGKKDRAHPAAANLANDFVGANALAYPRLFGADPLTVVSVGKGVHSGAKRGWRDEKRSGFVM